MAKLIKAKQGDEIITPENGTDFSLEKLQNYVGGFIQIVNLSNDLIMVVNEEGKYLEGCEYNFLSIKIALEHKAIVCGDYICGDVVICKSEEVK